MENIPMMESLFPDLEPSPRADCNVLFSGPDVSITVPRGTLLIDAAREAGLYVPQQCGGLAICSWCRMEILQGEGHLSPPTEGEKRLREWEKLSENERASCQAEIHGDLIVDARYW